MVAPVSQLPLPASARSRDRDSERPLGRERPPGLSTPSQRRRETDTEGAGNRRVAARETRPDSRPS
jgi:hypothetical protein